MWYICKDCKYNKYLFTYIINEVRIGTRFWFYKKRRLKKYLPLLLMFWPIWYLYQKQAAAMLGNRETFCQSRVHFTSQWLFSYWWFPWFCQKEQTSLQGSLKPWLGHIVAFLDQVSLFLFFCCLDSKDEKPIFFLEFEPLFPHFKRSLKY